MKNFILSLSLIITSSLIANELQWVDEQIQAIKPSRNGVLKSRVNAIQNPFIFLNKKKEELPSKEKKIATSTSNSSKSTLPQSKKTKISKSTKNLILDAIINKSALINGRWYKLNSTIGKYTLSSVNKTNVVLSYKSKELVLSTRSKNKKLKFKNN